MIRLEAHAGSRPLRFRAVLTIALASVALRIVLAALFDLAGENFTDQASYVLMARSLWREGEFLVLGGPSGHYPPLYPALLAPGTAAGVRDLVVFAAIGNLAMASGLVPLWLVARRFLEPRLLVLGLVLTSLAPSILLLPTEFFSENLFYPLFWWWAWAGLRLGESWRARWAVLWGLLLGALVLTRTIGLALVGAAPCALVLEAILAGRSRGPREVLRGAARGLLLAALALAVAALVVLPWEYRNVDTHGRAMPGYAEAQGRIAGEPPPPRSPWVALPLKVVAELSHASFGSGLILFALAILATRAAGDLGRCARMASLSLGFFALASSYHQYIGSRYGAVEIPEIQVHGRYIAQVFPLLVLSGLGGLARAGRAPAFVVAGACALLAALPFPCYRDLETRLLLQVFWATGSAWAVRFTLMATLAGLWAIRALGMRRLLAATLVLLFVVADLHAVLYLHGVGDSIGEFRKMAEAASRLAPGGVSYLDPRPAINPGPHVTFPMWALALWGRCDVREGSSSESSHELTWIARAGESPSAMFAVPDGAERERWWVLWLYPAARPATPDRK